MKRILISLFVCLSSIAYSLEVVDTLPVGLELDSQMITGAFINSSAVIGSAYTCISRTIIPLNSDTVIIEGFHDFGSVVMEFDDVTLTDDAAIRWQVRVDSVWQTANDYYGASTAFFDLTNDRTISNATDDVLLASYFTSGSGLTGRWYAYGLNSGIPLYGESFLQNIEFQASYEVHFNKNEVADRVDAFRFFVDGPETFNKGAIELFGLNACN